MSEYLEVSEHTREGLVQFIEKLEAEYRLTGSSSDEEYWRSKFDEDPVMAKEALDAYERVSESIWAAIQLIDKIMTRRRSLS
jgi:hypothetical protein